MAAGTVDLPERYVAAGLPPWPWVWALGLYVWGVADRFRFEWDGLRGGGATFGEVAHLDGYALVRALSGASLVISLLVLAGVLSWFAPRLRSRFVETRYALGHPDAEPAFGALGEIRSRAREQAHGEVRADLERGDRTAAIYPNGLHRPVLAVFAGLVQLWRTDRVAGEAVVDRELAQLRSGDHLVRGCGSLFEQALRVGVPVAAVAAFVPLLSAQARGVVAFAAAEATANVLFIVFLPIVALWLLELDADREVALHGGRTGLRRALRSAGRGRPWWRQGLAAVTRPPRTLRGALVDRWGGTGTQVALLVAFPVAYLLQVPLVAVATWQASMRAGNSASQAWDLVRPDAVDLLGTMAPRAAAMLALALAWPWLAPWWRLLHRPARAR
jgi:hypothetical protein